MLSITVWLLVNGALTPPKTSLCKRCCPAHFRMMNVSQIKDAEWCITVTLGKMAPGKNY